MIELLGIETFNAVRAGLGGAEIAVPKTSVLTEDHLIVRRLGWEVATQLCDEFASSKMYIPKRDPGNQERDEYITNAIMAGVPRNEIALNLNLSASYLRRLILKLGLSGFVVNEQDECGTPPIPPTVSSGGLTRHGAFCVPTRHPTPESRASGL
ncbi:hypothetical protein [Rhizobium sp. FY34]|uniref:hypothetical protein n=1 Tax=Rhizobium sp. FY34 TaxID=2562309 RepID=UPI0010BF9DB3|nr:hypothetical protein [Rhizobium sp. FY34]